MGPLRPLRDVMQDKIPEDRWESELESIQRAGYADLQSYLRDNFVKDNKGNVIKRGTDTKK